MEDEPGVSGLARICSFAVPAHCPFCTATASPLLEVGDEVMVLSGVLTGLRARVVPVQAGWSNSLRPGEIYLQPLDGAAGFYTLRSPESVITMPGISDQDGSE